jgi:acetyl-CoA C-acetyltransferase
MAANGSETNEDRIPVIVGVGEIVDRPNEIAAGLEPLALLGVQSQILMVSILSRQEEDARGKRSSRLRPRDAVSSSRVPGM